MRCILWGLVTSALAYVDLYCKSYMENNYDKLKKKEICCGKIELRKVHNRGLAMGAGKKYPETTRLASGLVCVTTFLNAISVWRKCRGFWRNFAVALTLAGAISNTYDRFVRKYVVDYFGFKTKVEKFNRITFNLADMFIFLGSGILLIVDLFGKNRD